LLIRGVTRRGAENGKGVLGSLYAGGRLFVFLLQFAGENAVQTDVNEA